MTACERSSPRYVSFQLKHASRPLSCESLIGNGCLLQARATKARLSEEKLRLQVPPLGRSPLRMSPATAWVASCDGL